MQEEIWYWWKVRSGGLPIQQEFDCNWDDWDGLGNAHLRNILPKDVKYRVQI